MGLRLTLPFLAGGDPEGRLHHLRDRYVAAADVNLVAGYDGYGY